MTQKPPTNNNPVGKFVLGCLALFVLWLSSPDRDSPKGDSGGPVPRSFQRPEPEGDLGINWNDTNTGEPVATIDHTEPTKKLTLRLGVVKNEGCETTGDISVTVSAGGYTLASEQYGTIASNESWPSSPLELSLSLDSKTVAQMAEGKPVPVRVTIADPLHFRLDGQKSKCQLSVTFESYFRARDWLDDERTRAERNGELTALWNRWSVFPACTAILVLTLAVWWRPSLRRLATQQFKARFFGKLVALSGVPLVSTGMLALWWSGLGAWLQPLRDRTLYGFWSLNHWLALSLSGQLETNPARSILICVFIGTLTGAMMVQWRAGMRHDILRCKRLASGLAVALSLSCAGLAWFSAKPLVIHYQPEEVSRGGSADLGPQQTFVWLGEEYGAWISDSSSPPLSIHPEKQAESDDRDEK